MPLDNGRGHNQSMVERKIKAADGSVPCKTCGDDVPRLDIADHLQKHNSRAIEQRRAAEAEKRVDRIITSMLEESARMDHVLQSPIRSSRRDSAKDGICSECKRRMPSAFMNQHKQEKHTEPRLPDISAAYYPFIILPPGREWDYKTVFEHYLKKSRSHSFDSKSIDLSRLKRLHTLNPSLKRFGVGSWFAYAVYVFSYTERVVLECPVVGNATYVLWGEWEDKISLSKGELRHKHRGQFRKIVHAGDWLTEVKRALGQCAGGS